MQIYTNGDRNLRFLASCDKRGIISFCDFRMSKRMFVIYIQVKMKFRFDILKSDYGINIDDIQRFEFQCTFTFILTHSVLI